MSQMYFDVWPAGDLNGTAIGELTQASGKTIRVVDQGIGSFQFTINRHDSQFAWCDRDNLVRVRLVTGGPFAYDDTRYVEAFFISDGDDVVVSEDEEGGEDITRGGPSAITILTRGIVDYKVEDATPLHAKYWRTALKSGVVTFLERNPGEVLRILLQNVVYRDPSILAPLQQHFSGDGGSTPGRDSAGDLWTDSDATWEIPVGMDMLECLKLLSATQMWWKMTPSFDLYAYDNDPGVDDTDVLFEKGVNIITSAEREVHTRQAISAALVEGTLKDGGKTYRWSIDAGTATLLDGRREGFREYQATPTPARLDRAGEKAIISARTEYNGPTTMGVLDTPGAEAFVDYRPGSYVTVNVPDIFDSIETRVYAITLNELTAGEYDALIEFEQVPWDGLTNEAWEQSPCKGCPPLTPHDGGVQEGDPPPEPDVTLYICNGVMEPGEERTALIESVARAFTAGEIWTYRITNPVHDGAAVTSGLRLDVTTAGPIVRAWGSGFGYGTGTGVAEGVAGSGAGYEEPDQGFPPVAMPEQTGTFAVTATATGKFRLNTNTGYYGIPGLPVVDECYQVELWQGVVDLNGTPDIPIPPDTGQPVTGEVPAISIGSTTTTLTVDWPYAAGSLRIRVDGVLISPAAYTETTPGSGVVTLAWALDADETVTIDYQAAT